MSITQFFTRLCFYNQIFIKVIMFFIKKEKNLQNICFEFHCIFNYTSLVQPAWPFSAKADFIIIVN